MTKGTRKLNRRRRTFIAVAGVGVGGTIALTGALAIAPLDLTGVPTARTKVVGVSPETVVSPELRNVAIARGSDLVENPTADVTMYGYQGSGPLVPVAGSNVEAQKTEPDKNVYLRFRRGLPGGDPTYRYGTRFLFQGHETGTFGEITRINLDADQAHRVTLLATTDAAGAKLPTFDGITWDPFAKKLLLTAEAGAKGGVWQANVDTVPATVTDISGVTGRAGYEGVQNDDRGNVYLVEDVGGPNGTVNTKAKQPNSFVYRLVPTDRRDLTKGGRLQALQVMDRAGVPVVFHAGQADADITAQIQRDLATPGVTFRTKWVTIHDTAVDGTAPFDAGALAKVKMATPFKRPENGVFRPGTRFREFFFTVTGDTNDLSQANAQFGGWGGVMRLTQDPRGDEGTIALAIAGDREHTGFDNITFTGRTSVMVSEDAGDTLHTQRNALDSAFIYNLRDTSNPIRVIAEGRDPSATIDSALSGTPGFVNDGDNEVTGIHVSEGSPGVDGILGRRIPRPWRRNSAWRVFWTQQHGDNVTYELIAPRVTR